ncbi:DUF4292 domain-containing protein [Pedobacter sp. SYSU D00535]|uniref:DUF4292 domain-containing protein n=1 Tax=Pedobacter sp. SYSU D00535 TaxID=2810308 RepID=UPI001A969F4F|nr:DUF4292 domain-containing protein [Pedobacter sp. SYSU D00535]
MERSFWSKILILALLVVASGCKTRKLTTITGTTVAPPAGTAESASAKAEALRKITERQVDFNTLAIKAKADLNINNNSNDVSMSIRLKKDEAMWVSVTALAGLEVARALVTPDSIKILNRFQGEYTKKPFSYIHQFTNRSVDFKTVQALFTGSAIPGSLTENANVDIREGQTIVEGSLSGLIYALIFNDGNNLVQNTVKNQETNQRLAVSYGNFANVKGQIFPQNVTIKSAANNQNVAINLQYNSISLNEPVDMPFSVPKRFSVKN